MSEKIIFDADSVVAILTDMKYCCDVLKQKNQEMEGYCKQLNDNFLDSDGEEIIGMIKKSQKRIQDTEHKIRKLISKTCDYTEKILDLME